MNAEDAYQHVRENSNLRQEVRERIRDSVGRLAYLPD